ncbi:Retrovirus-related Pol polyprotein from transposon TNT 1-94 [Vitis vinifera]|uniref:Retrovirus-related Pol polyprotein from transposon TNT 1-94 n=1 Tax=Vitis vinifera TaxID=29760 RepID=A0A438KDA9_VITVI|nr:Retrovirus-related Pol polyprotein from transposon TNT 1-94 [Vitis vinifera]
MKVKEWALLDRQVLGVIRLTLSRSVAHNVVKEKTTANLMKALFEIDFDGEIRALIVLASLPNSWEAMRMAGRLKSRNSNQNRRKSRSGQQVQCWNCGKIGHFRRQCKNPKKKNEDDSANAGTEEVHDALLLAVDNPLDDWVLDSGTLYNTTLHREIIQNYAVGDFGKVYLADGSALDVVGLGDVQILLPNGSVWLLEKVTKGARVLARGKKTGTLYMTSCPRDTIAVADANTDTSLWHRRLCHMSEKWMKMLLSKGKLPELKTPKAEKLKLVHTDLWGLLWLHPLEVQGTTSLLLMTQAERNRFESKMFENGVVERMNKTLNERARSMRLHVGLSKTFWADAISTATDLINQGPSIPMEFRLLEEVWSGKKVLYKDRSTIVSDVIEIDQKKFEFVNLDELTESTVQKMGEEDKENVNSQVDLSTPVAKVRRSSRNIRPPRCYSSILNYLLLADGGEPKCYDEALQDENSSKWELAMKDEMDSLLGNQTWELTELLVGNKTLHNKWVYRIKNEYDGNKRYKDRLVVKGNLHLEQLDVKTTFLHGDLEEDLYMIQPKGFIVQGQENLVCKLRKSLYGLKQAPRQWYKKFDSFMHRIGFKRCEVDHYCYVKSFDNSYIILLLYVDDMLIAGFNMNEAKPVSTPLGSHFKLSKEQSPKTEEEMDHMSKVPYASAIGSLMNAMVCTRPDIAHAVGVVSRFMSRLEK